MVDNYRSRPQKSARGPARRSVKRRFLIVSEGEVTEPEYLRGFNAHHRAALIEIVCDIRGVGRGPMPVVRRAIELRDQAHNKARQIGDTFEEYDDVWCVVDVDSHADISDARQAAKDNGLRLAISNPCFELWLLLHLIDDAPGSLQSREASKRLKKHWPTYEKGVNFRDCVDGYSRAMQLAKQLYKQAREAREPLRNPLTGVYRLTESILASGREASWDEWQAGFEEEDPEI